MKNAAAKAAAATPSSAQLRGKRFIFRPSARFFAMIPMFLIVAAFIAGLNVAIDTTAGGHTRLVGDVRDAAHLHGVINQLTSLAIELVSLTPAGSARSLHEPTPSKEAP